MLAPTSGFGGTGSSVPCTWCGCNLTYRTVEADRVVPGEAGGRYVRGNVVPACRRCNERRNVTTLLPHALSFHPLSNIPLKNFCETLDSREAV